MNSKVVIIMLLLLSISGLLLLKYDFKFTSALYMLNVFVASYMLGYASPLFNGRLAADHVVRVIIAWLLRFALTAMILFITLMVPRYILYGNEELGLNIFPDGVIHLSMVDAVIFYTCVIVFIGVQFFSYYKYPLPIAKKST